MRIGITDLSPCDADLRYADDPDWTEDARDEQRREDAEIAAAEEEDWRDDCDDRSWYL